MADAIDEFHKAMRRRAIRMEIGGFRAPADPLSSWFGRAAFGLPGETWPSADGRSLHALCQINLTELPFRPPRLDDLEFITVFIDPDELPSDTPNGEGWCLRGYRRVDDLVPLPQGDIASPVKPFPMRPQAVEIDFPCWEDLRGEIPAEVDDRYQENFENIPGFKLGGWPTLIQSEIYWAPLQQHPIAPEYVFQIDTTEKGNWMWGDNGVGYFGRGTADGRRDEWAFEWQCF